MTAMKALESLHYYRRHTPRCTAPPSSFNECDCTIWVKGRTSTGEPVPRQTTKASDLTAAQRFGAELDAASLALRQKPAIHGLTVRDAAKEFMLSKRDMIADSTRDNYLTTLNNFVAFCHRHGAIYMKELNVDIVERFRYSLPQPKPASRKFVMNKVAAFLNAAHRRDWTTKDIVSCLEKITIPHEQKEPFSDRDIALILEGAGELETANRRSPYARNPQTLKLLIQVALHTGMRMGDAIKFDPAKLRRGPHGWRYTFVPEKQKTTETKKEVTVTLEDSVKQSVESCIWLSARLPFRPPNVKRPRQAVYDLMQQIGERKGIPDCRCHRLRDTFAVKLLLAGALLEEVSELLGHSSIQITHKYYARWTRERKNRLEERLAAYRLEPAANCAL